MGFGSGAGDVASLGAAGAVAQEQGAAPGRGIELLGPPEVQDLAVAPEDGGDDPGIAGQAAYPIVAVPSSARR
jgi:hypothetical protein